VNLVNFSFLFSKKTNKREVMKEKEFCGRSRRPWTRFSAEAPLKRLAMVLVALLALGCGKGYTENERLNYFDAADEIIAGHEIVSSQLDVTKPQDQFGPTPERLGPLTDRFQAFRSRYQATPLEADVQLLPHLSKLESLAQDSKALDWDGTSDFPEEASKRQEIAWSEYPKAVHATKAAAAAARRGGENE
jgi:hypothetical protein